MQIPGQTKVRCHPLWTPDQHTRTPGRRVWGWQTWSHDLSHRLISYSLLTTGSDHILTKLVSRPLSRPRTLSCHIFSHSASLPSSLYGWFGISVHIMKISNPCHIISTTLAPISNTLKSVFGTHRAPKRAPFDTKYSFWSSQGLIERTSWGEHYTMLIDFQGMIMVGSAKDHHHGRPHHYHLMVTTTKDDDTAGKATLVQKLCMQTRTPESSSN